MVVRIGFENADLDNQNFGQRGSGDSVGAQRQSGWRPDKVRHYEDLIIAPNLWSGFSRLRGGPPLGIVGNYEQCAARLDELVRLGADAFILAATPHLEESYRIGEEVLPLLGRDVSARLAAE